MQISVFFTVSFEIFACISKVIPTGVSSPTISPMSIEGSIINGFGIPVLDLILLKLSKPVNIKSSNFFDEQ